MSTRWSGTLRLSGWAWLAAVLACVPLGPLVDAKSFLLVGALAGALVVAAGAMGRLAHLPAPVIALVQLLVLLAWATFAYARAEALVGVLATPSSVRVFVDLVQAAIETSNANIPPAPADQGVSACLAVIVALAVLVVDLVAVTLRRPALVGLVFLGIYMAPVSLLAGNVPVLVFIPGALGYVFLLAAEQRDRLSHWGRQITHAGTLLAGQDQLGPTVTSLVSAGRRVGFGAVALAVVLPVLVPTLPRTFLGDGPLTADGQFGDGNGGDGPVDLDNPMLDLRKNLGEQSESVLVTFATDDPAPGYLRIAVLDNFTSDSWQPGERSEDTSAELADVPRAPGLSPDVQRSVVTYDVEITDDLRSTWLPVGYPITTVTADGSWGVDVIHLDVSARGDTSTEGMDYAFSALQVAPTREQLLAAGRPPPGLEDFVQLPTDLPDEISQTAADVTADDATAIERALTLQDWFRVDGGFEYSVASGEGDGIDTIRDFITTNRSGYCEQFAASMALMARTLDIPARVAVGFLRPTQTGDNTFEYRGKDMHAWPELYFEGVGWVRFEPTPSIRTGDAPDYAPDSNTVTGPTRPTDGQGPGELNPLEETTGPGAAAAGTAGSGGGVDATLVGGIGAALLLSAFVLSPRLVRSAVRRRRWARAADGDVEPAWTELRDSTVDLGLHFDDQATARGAGRALRPWLESRPDAVTALNRLVVRVEHARFARPGTLSGSASGTGPEQVAATRSDVQRVLDGLMARRSRGQLARATWLPASLLPASWRWGRRRDRRADHLVAYGRDGVVVQVEGTATR